jgi:hypothetical protein
MLPSVVSLCLPTTIRLVSSYPYKFRQFTSVGCVQTKCSLPHVHKRILTGGPRILQRKQDGAASHLNALFDDDDFVEDGRPADQATVASLVPLSLISVQHLVREAIERNTIEDVDDSDACSEEVCSSLVSPISDDVNSVFFLKDI